MKCLGHLAICLVFASPVYAQHAPRVDVVAQAKADLQAAGTDFASPCGAFSITKLVAWRLRGEGAGLLAKPSGNNCQGFSVDRIIYRDGLSYDILGSAGDPGGSIPGWGGETNEGAAAWRDPIDPGPIGPPQPPLPPSVDLTQVLNRLKVLEDAVAVQKDTLQIVSDQLDSHSRNEGARVEANYNYFDMQDKAIDARLKALEAKPIPTSCTVRAFGIGFSCRLQ